MVGPTNTSFGETPVIPGNATDIINTPAWRRALLRLRPAQRRPADRRRTTLLPDGTGPVADVGDRFSGTTVGVMDYNFGDFYLMLTAAPDVVSGGTSSARSPRRRRDSQLAVATFNVENLAPSDPQTKFDRLAGQIVAQPAGARISLRWRRSRTTAAPRTTASWPPT